jgi:thiamine pyrophosphate-dependent acetolactate synthase large subunit-like protein
MWIARNFPTYCPNGCIISNGLAGMGIALPGGVGFTCIVFVDNDYGLIS